MAALAASSAAVAVAATAVSSTSESRTTVQARSVQLRVSALQGQKLRSTVCNGGRVAMMAETAVPETEAPKGGFTPPTLNADTPAPIFGGSTGGLLRKAQVEEFYVITWESPKEQIFEMPTGTVFAGCVWV